MHSGCVIDLVRRLGTQVAERVVRQRREMNHRVKAFEVVRLHVTDVLVHRGDVGGRLAVGARVVEVSVEARDVVTGRVEHRRQHTADVAVVAGDENLHVTSS